MSMNRREFIRDTAAAVAASALGGCAATKGAGTRAAMPKEIWGVLAHFGTMMWEKRANNTRFDFDESVWKAVMDRIAEKKLNTVVIDLGEGIYYPSHPELGKPGAWEPERMREEIARLKRMGIMAVPKLNFSSTHDQWLGKWRNYLSTARYYQTCADVIRDVAEIFDEAPLFHLGWDEETARAQGEAAVVRLRQGDLWWHDFLFTVGEAERHGMRAWIWSDAYWHHPDEFMKRMPKRVLQSNWYYGRDLSAEHLAKLDKELGPNWGGSRVREVAAWAELGKAGYDQVPTGSTWHMKGFQTQNFPKVVRHCREVVAPERLKGFLMAPWLVETNKANLQKMLDSVDNAADAKDADAKGRN